MALPAGVDSQLSAAVQHCRTVSTVIQNATTAVQVLGSNLQSSASSASDLVKAVTTVQTRLGEGAQVANALNSEIMTLLSAASAAGLNVEALSTATHVTDTVGSVQSAQVGLNQAALGLTAEYAQGLTALPLSLLGPAVGETLLHGGFGAYPSTNVNLTAYGSPAGMPASSAGGVDDDYGSTDHHSKKRRTHTHYVCPYCPPQGDGKNRDMQGRRNVRIHFHSKQTNHRDRFIKENAGSMRALVMGGGVPVIQFGGVDTCLGCREDPAISEKHSTCIPQLTAFIFSALGPQQAMALGLQAPAAGTYEGSPAVLGSSLGGAGAGAGPDSGLGLGGLMGQGLSVTGGLGGLGGLAGPA